MVFKMGALDDRMDRLETRMDRGEKKVDVFKDEVHKNDLTTVTTLSRVETLLNGLLTKKGAMGYGASSGGIIYIILEFLFM